MQLLYFVTKSLTPLGVKELVFIKSKLSYVSSFFSCFTYFSIFFVGLLCHSFNNRHLSTFYFKKLILSVRYQFFRYFYLGLGYKMFLRKFKLYIWLGLTHYTIIDIPINIKLFTRKRRLFITSFNNDVAFKEFIFKIRSTRKIDLYKGKGLLEIKTYKNTIKMKSGKKKQY